MKLAIDIDDTLADTFDYMIPFVAEFFHADPAELDARGISYCTLPDGWREREIAFCRSCYDQVVEDTPFKPDAAEYVRRLHDLGHEIVILTARTTDLYTDPEETTRRELAKHNIVYDHLICAVDKAAACRREGVELLIDDSVENCRAVSESGVPVLLFTSRWNRAEEIPFRRAASWREVFELLTSPA